MAPLHFAFMHHDEADGHQNKNTIVSAPKKHCSYCDFHFFHFIDNVSFYTDNNFINHVFSTKATGILSLFFVSYLNKSVLGRAPPLTS